MSVNQNGRPQEKLVEKVRESEYGWTQDVSYENVSEDEEFLYLEIEDLEGSGGQFQELGAELGARTTGTVNYGERYFLSVEKHKL